MIEAANTVLQTSQFVRPQAVQNSAVESFAANPDRVQKVPLAPFVSPYIHVDVNYNKAVLQLRNGDTGDVENQYPSPQTLEAQARYAAARQAAEQHQQDIQTQQQQPAPRQSGQQPQQQTVQQPVSQPTPEQKSAAAKAAQQYATFAAAAANGNSNAGVTVFA
jgi:hypothetical protein